MSSNQKRGSKKNQDAENRVEIHYIKGNHFRVVYADGVWGGATPRGYISMSFFSERLPIPKKLVHEIKDGGGLSKESIAESRTGLIREVDVEVIMDLEMAKSFRRWLDQKIFFLETQAKKHGSNIK